MISTPNEHADRPDKGQPRGLSCPSGYRTRGQSGPCPVCPARVRSVRLAYLYAIKPLPKPLDGLTRDLVKGRQFWRTQAPRRHP